MKFSKFEELFLAKYPNGEVIPHGKFSGTEKNNKVTVIFNKLGKCYNYYGAYEDILCKVGIPVISIERFNSLQKQLEYFKNEHGKEYLFFDDCENEKIDYSHEIEEISNRIKEIQSNYIIVK